jgi:hypothetical protein
MAIFRQSPEKSAAKDLDTAQANLSRLKAKLNDAELAVIATKSAAQRAALAGDDVALDRAEVDEGAALRRHSTIVAALAEAGKVVALLESQLAETIDKKTRAATAAATAELADELKQAGESLDIALGTMAEVAGRVLLISVEGNGLSVFVSSAKVEVAAAVEVLGMVLHEYGRAVLNNLAPAAMPKPAPEPAKVVPVVKAALVSVFATKPVKWRDADGKQRASGKCVDVELPPATAKRAIAIGAAVPIDNPLRAKNLGMWPGNYSLSQCVDLDAPEPKTDAAAPDPILSSHIQVVDRGVPFVLRIAGAK